MRTHRLFYTVLLIMSANTIRANVPENMRNIPPVKQVQYRDICANSKSQIDQEINNVRARLLGGGDCWWDLTRGRYIVPKVDPASGQPEVSSIFAGAVWLAGIDPGKNLKLAGQTYRSDGKNDFWPGPIDAYGYASDESCNHWDRHFRVTGAEIRQHLTNLANGDFNPDHIPEGLRGWPASRNPYFTEVWGFELPNNSQSLAGFLDADNDGIYDPLKGDYPSLEIRGCPSNRYPDEMIFWIFNDNGGGQPHARTNGKPLNIEVQVQAFGFVSDDELNDMTFQRYKLINRSIQQLDSTFFAIWMDPDLGCSIDDYVGCDSTRNLAYVYNKDSTDGQPGISCDGGVATYGDHIPILGVDYLRGPMSAPDEFGIQRELGMSSFMYYEREGTGALNGTTGPDQPGEYYNYMTGTWKDGTPLTHGGSGYNQGSTKRVHYCFNDPPNSTTGWSMCSTNMGEGDRRTIQASGPFTLMPGAVNELIIGIPWVPDQVYPCPDLSALFRADDLAQYVFDQCFIDNFGIDAPATNWIELDQEVVGVLTNDHPSSNYNEAFRSTDYFSPKEFTTSPDSATREKAFYHFEGYLVYQLSGPDVKSTEFTDPDKSRLVYNFDVKNGITKIYNWKTTRDPASNKVVYLPELAVEGTDSGVKHTFSVKDDKFASGNDKALINHKKYYFAVLAYAYNNYKSFDPLELPIATGQKHPLLLSKRSIDGAPIKIYTVIPRPIVDHALQASYGDGVEITRLQGVGAGGNFLDLTADTRVALLTPGFDSTLTYKPGRAPINVTIFNPFEVKDGDYELVLIDHNNSDTQIDPDAHWQLRKLPDGIPVVSDQSIAQINEQIVAQYGFSVSIVQTVNPGDLADEQNGAIGMEVEYTNPDIHWLTGWPDGDVAPFNYVRTKKLEVDYDPNKDLKPLDPQQRLSTLGNAKDGRLGWFVPYVLTDWRLINLTNNPNDRMMSPAWQDQYSIAPEGLFSIKASQGDSAGEIPRRHKLAALPNVDIVLTSDKSKWSRCVVVEGATPYYTDTSRYKYVRKPFLWPEGPNGGKRNHFDLRYALSVGKDDTDGDGIPDPDGDIYPPGTPKNLAGKPVYGMGWFPGYAVDVETGRRLNVFFSENSCFAKSVNPEFTGRDMLWNPTNRVVIPTLSDIQGLILGGQHWVYVTYTDYDSCKALQHALTPEFYTGAQAFSQKIPQIQNIAWAGMVQLAPGSAMKPLKDGLIPDDAVVKLRVDHPYQTWWNPSDPTRKNAHPKYLIKIRGKEPLPFASVQINNALDSVKAVPNPYYGFSDYETDQATGRIKITNLPATCTVTIYTLAGRLVRQFNRNEMYEPYHQIAPDLEWDLKNTYGHPVASGVYLFRIEAPDIGARTIKWFGITRKSG
jgi:hypothetical protein